MKTGILSAIGLILLGSACRSRNPEPHSASNLASLAVGKFEPAAGKSPWTILNLRLEKVAPAPDKLEKQFAKSAFDQGQAKDVSINVPYGTYKIHLDYSNASVLVYQACTTPETRIDVPEFTTRIAICEVGQTTPVGEVPIDPVKASDVTIKPVAKDDKVPVDPGKPIETSLGKRLLIGYWHNFNNGSGFIKLSDVASQWDIIDVAFAEPETTQVMKFEPYGYANAEEFKADVKKVQAAGKKVIISIGGEKGHVSLDTADKTSNFISSMEKIIADYGFDGLDIDFEGQSLYLDKDDFDINQPKTPVLVNLIKAVKTLRERFGAKFLVTMAPETFFVQVGYSNYGATGNGDRRAGAYLPVIQALNRSGYLTLLHVQNYNSGPIMGFDQTYHTMGNADFHVTMLEMLIQGFQILGRAGEQYRFEGLKPEQLAIGVPSAQFAGNGFTSNEELQKAFTCLEKGTGCSRPLLKAGGYPGLRGIMTWSINWDRFDGSKFSTGHRTFLDAL